MVQHQFSSSDDELSDADESVSVFDLENGKRLLTELLQTNDRDVWMSTLSSNQLDDLFVAISDESLVVSENEHANLCLLWKKHAWKK